MNKSLRKTVPFDIAVACDIRARSQMKTGWLPCAFVTALIRPMIREQATKKPSRALIPYVHVGEIVE